MGGTPAAATRHLILARGTAARGRCVTLSRSRLSRRGLATPSCRDFGSAYVGAVAFVVVVALEVEPEEATSSLGLATKR